ncbi:hypothetical protein CVIRNUC_004518 [Coccomyxa viridis]|uniref:G9405 protein n=2 Tax=Coccomyxa viridis TaxID=1274662 RepID=A0ABP1G728_9CHLO|nr:hypothetical protein CVIRNUC_004518 [Coccomyxa viridis]
MRKTALEGEVLADTSTWIVLRDRETERPRKDCATQYHSDMYLEERPLEQIVEEGCRMLRKHPDKIPCVIEPGSPETPAMDRRKWLFPRDVTVGGLLTVIRRHTILKPDQAVFVFIGNTLPKSSDSMEDVYDTHRHRDTGLLFIQYSLERTYG